MPSLLFLFGFLFSPFGINQMFLMTSMFLLRYLGGKLMGSSRISTGNHRPRLLHSWATSLFCIANNIYEKVSDNRVGYLARTLVYIASFILYPMKQQWLATLSFIDDGILAAEGVVMTVCPQTAHFFIKVDELALFGQSLPQKLDHAMDNLLKSFFSKSESTSDKRDIMVDIKCDEQPKLVAKSTEEADDRTESGRREEIAKLSHDKAWNKPSMEDDIREVEETCKGIIGALAEMGMTAKEKGADSEVGCRHVDEKVAQPDSADRKKMVEAAEKGTDHGEFGGERREDETATKQESGDNEGIVEEKRDHSKVVRKRSSNEKLASGIREMVVEDKKGADDEVGGKRNVDETLAGSQSGDKEVGGKNAILDLFDEGWQLKSIAGKKAQ